MLLATLLAFLFLGAAFLSLWIRKDPKIWASLLGASLLCGLVASHIYFSGLIFIIALAYLWVVYHQTLHLPLFMLLIVASTLLKMRLIVGYAPFFFTSKFALGLEGSLIGLFPLAFLVPLAKSFKEWQVVFKGLLFGCIGIAILALLATLSNAIQWQFKAPSFAAVRLLSNFFLTSIPEEGFYRGFVQSTLCNYFKSLKLGKCFALIATSILFTIPHISWSPNPQLLLFVFIASLLYGGIYLIFRKVESAILSHFILNAIHMTFFSYHAM